MAGVFGEVYEDRQAGRKTRWRIYLGKQDGRAVCLRGTPNQLEPHKPVRFATREQAELQQDLIRSHVKSGWSREQIVSAYVPSEIEKKLVETVAEAYLAHFQAKVDAGDRKPGQPAGAEEVGVGGGTLGLLVGA